MMKNIMEERRVLSEQAREIAEDRKKLTELYFMLKDRLERLEELELKGLDNLSIKGYVEMKADYDNDTSLKNIQREIDTLTDKIEKLKKAESETKDRKDSPEQPEEKVIPKLEISEAKWRERVNKTLPTNHKKKRRKNRRDNSFIYKTIYKEFKERPNKNIDASTMYEILLGYQEFRDMDIPLKEFRSNMFYRTVMANKDTIRKVEKGLYRYISPIVLESDTTKDNHELEPVESKAIEEVLETV